MDSIDWRAKAQPALSRAGLYHGKIDGDRRMLTIKALLNFAAERDTGGVGDEIAADALANWDAYGMTTPARLAEFLAQISHETGGFKRFEEDLRYSAAGLARTWPGRFAVNPDAKTKLPNALAKKLAGKPIDIANSVYARPKEGNTEPGDGWRYRGRGALQLTFRNNYHAAGQRLKKPLEEHPELAAQPGLSHLIALDFWRRAAVNACCDAGDFYGARGLTNVGNRTPKVAPIGLADVARRRTRLLSILS